MIREKEFIQMLEYALESNKFNIAIFSKTIEENNVCKTICCFAGSLPILFPDDWMLEGGSKNIPVCILNPYYKEDDLSDNLEFYFGLEKSKTDRIFYRTDTPPSILSTDAVYFVEKALEITKLNKKYTIKDNKICIITKQD